MPTNSKISPKDIIMSAKKLPAKKPTLQKQITASITKRIDAFMKRRPHRSFRRTKSRDYKRT